MVFNLTFKNEKSTGSLLAETSLVKSPNLFKVQRIFVLKCSKLAEKTMN